MLVCSQRLRPRQQAMQPVRPDAAACNLSETEQWQVVPVDCVAEELRHCLCGSLQGDGITVGGSHGCETAEFSCNLTELLHRRLLVG